MKVAMSVVRARRERLAELLRASGYLPVSELAETLGVSEMTIRRDLAELESAQRIRRTYGGALAEYNDRFPSFHERQRANRDAKRRIALAALEFVRGARTIFLDSGTTIFTLAEVLAERSPADLQVVTTNLPVAELLAAAGGVRVFLLAGEILPRQSILVGETVVRSLEFWDFDAGFFSAEAMDAGGLKNSRPEVVGLQLAAMTRCGKRIFCLDGSKVGRDAPARLCGWSEVDHLVSDMPSAALRRAGMRGKRRRHE